MARLVGYVSKNGGAAARAYGMLTNKTNGISSDNVKWWMGATYNGLINQYTERNPESLPKSGCDIAIGFSKNGGKKEKKRDTPLVLKPPHTNSAAIYTGASSAGLVKELYNELEQNMQTEDRIKKFLDRHKDSSVVLAYGDQRIFAGASGKKRLMYSESKDGYGIASDWGAFTQTQTNQYEVDALMIVENGVKEISNVDRDVKGLRAVAPRTC